MIPKVGFETHGERLELRLIAAIEALEGLETPLLEAIMLERDRAVQRIKVGGDPPWPPSKKTLGGTITAGVPGAWAERVGIDRGDRITLGGYGQTGIDEGTMLRAVEGAEPTFDGAHTVLLSVNVRTADGKYNYAQIFQEGSGVFAGHSPWTIVPTQAQVLAWQVGGTWFFAHSVTMQGQPPRPFLYIEGTETEVAAIFRSWLERALGAA